MFNHSSIKMDPYTTWWKSTIKVGFLLSTLPFGYLSHRSSDKSWKGHENRRRGFTESIKYYSNIWYLIICVGITDICQRVKSLLHRFLSRCNVHQILVVVSSERLGEQHDSAWLKNMPCGAGCRPLTDLRKSQFGPIWIYLDYVIVTACIWHWLA